MNLTDLKAQFLFHAENPAQAELLFNNFLVLLNAVSDDVIRSVATALDAAPAEITTREQAFDYAMAQLRECMRPIE